MMSNELKFEDLPSPRDGQAVLEFAQKFNAYLHYGSFKAASAAARQSKRETVQELRTELFMAYRASNHGGTDDFMTTYFELLPHF